MTPPPPRPCEQHKPGPWAELVGLDGVELRRCLVCGKRTEWRPKR